MAVFISCSDESYDSDLFVYGGFAAPVDDWEGPFARAWYERVLLGPPQIPYLHMGDIYTARKRGLNWGDQFGLKPWELDRRIDAAVDVIRSTGSLVPVRWALSVAEYRSIVRQPFKPGPNWGKAQLEPDYICFMFAAFSHLDLLHQEYGSDVERVDFWVEENDRITRNMASFHRALASGLEYIGRAHLKPLIGQYLPVEKERIPAQAADLLQWHQRHYKRETLDRLGLRRLWKMIEGGHGRIRSLRPGYSGTLGESDLQRLADGFAQNPSALQRPPYAEDDEGGNAT